ncbi:MAG TPA: EI24 domain-containing protein [Verrucomicrobiae bacterium]
MSKLKEFTAGFRCHLRGHRLVMTHKLWRFIIIPGLLSLLYFPFVIWATFHGLRPVSRYLHENWIPGFLQSAFTLEILTLMVWLLGVYAGFMLFRNAIMVICSPLLSHISEIVEKVSGGVEAPKFTWEGTGKEIFRASVLSLLSLTISLIVFVFCLVIGIIPLLGAVVSFLIMSLVQMYLAGVGFADPALERRQYSIGSTLKFTRKHRPRLMGVGLGFLMLLAVPVFGWFIAPSYGVIAGTLAVLDLIEEEKKNRKPPVMPI